MSVTVVHTESWFSRIISSIKGILVGVVLFLAAIPLLFWNEHRAVQRYEALKEGAGAVISIDAGQVKPIDVDGKLVHCTGKAVTGEVLCDPMFELVKLPAIVLQRSVEMYQWKEEEKSSSHTNFGGSETTTTTYTYSKEWNAQALDSSSYKEQGHENPQEIYPEGKYWYAGEVKIGNFVLSESQIGSLTPCKDLTLSSEPLPKGYTASSNYYYTGNPAEPKVGDVRIQFKYVPASQTVSLVARASGNTFSPYITKNGQKVSMIQMDAAAAEEMFADAQHENTLMAWLLRAAGLLMMVIGFNLVLSPLSVLADVIPLLGRIVGVGTFLVSLVVSVPVWALVVSIAWLSCRPILSLLLILAASVVVLLVVKIAMKRRCGEANGAEKA